MTCTSASFPHLMDYFDSGEKVRRGTIFFVHLRCFSYLPLVFRLCSIPLPDAVVLYLPISALHSFSISSLIFLSHECYTQRHTTEGRLADAL
jgi:hypothetical protein